MPNHWVGLKLHHSRDNGSLPDNGEVVDPLDKRYTGDLTWLGINADNGFFDRRSPETLNYWAQATWLTGDIDELNQTVVGNDRLANGSRNVDVDAWALDLGLRWNINDQWKVGGAYARGSGGGDDDSSEQFRQTGMESNRSNFTGTNSRMHRFGEAFRGELSNLQVGTAFASWQLREDYDASVVYHRFWRVDDNQDVGQAGIIAPLEDGEKDVGQELDFVVTKYFKQGLLPASMAEHMDDASALVRFRGGVFAGRCLWQRHRLADASRLRRLHLALLRPPCAKENSHEKPHRNPTAAQRSGALLIAAPWAQAAEPAKELKETKNYTVTSAPVDQLHLDAPTLPDLSGYTAQAVEAKIDRSKQGKVVVRRMLQQDALKDFIGGNERMREWVTRQRGMPQAIFIEGGHVTPADIAKALPDSQFSETEPGVYIARLPVVVAQDANLEIGKDTRTSASPRSAAPSWSTTASCSSPAPG